MDAGTTDQAFLIDHHVHIGPFHQGIMFEPEDVAARLTVLGARRWVYFSTAFPCNPPNYLAWFKECIDRMDASAPGCGLPALWMNAAMFQTPDRYVDERYCAIKIHEGFEPLTKKLREHAFSLAQERGIPLIIHTGEDFPCRAGDYHALCGQFADLSVVLAHARPLPQALNMLARHPNVYVDTAFVPPESLCRLMTSPWRDRILFGSDFPIDTYFHPVQSAELNYRRCAAEYLTYFKVETPPVIFNR